MHDNSRVSASLSSTFSDLANSRSTVSISAEFTDYRLPITDSSYSRTHRQVSYKLIFLICAVRFRLQKKSAIPGNIYSRL